MSFRIVVTTTLNDNLLHAKLVPLLRAREDVEIVIVTDRPGKDIERVQWIYPEGKWAVLGRLGGRLPLLAREIWHPETRAVMAYNLMPHGWFAAIITRTHPVPLFLHFIGGTAEVRYAHDPGITDNRWIMRSRHPQWFEFFSRWTARRGDRLFVPGTHTADCLTALGCDPARIVKLHSTIDPERFFAGNEERDIDVLVSAQLRERKRPLFTLEVFAEIRRQRPQTRFTWLGDGPLHHEFEAARQRLDLNDCVEWRETSDVASYYRRAKVFLLCSVNEGLSLACMEAMACGAVPVATDCGDMIEVVRNGETGRLLPVTATQEEFASEVIALLENEAIRQKYSLVGQGLIRREHDFASATHAWKVIFETIA